MRSIGRRWETYRGERIGWFVLAQLLAILVDLVAARQRPERAKDLEIALLRHQLRLLQRRQRAPRRLTRWEKLPLAVLAAKVAAVTAGGRARLGRGLVLVQPEA